MGSPIDVGGQYPFITFFTPPRLSGKFLLWCMGRRTDDFATINDSREISRVYQLLTR